MSSQPTIQAAGCLLWHRNDAGAVEVALVHRQRHDDWTLAKGKLEIGEAWPAAAVREVAEETGFDVVLGPPLPTQTYVVDGAPKEVRYWSAEVTSDAFVPNLEVDEIRWLDPAEARTTLTYAHDSAVLDAFEDLNEAFGGSPSDTLVVLRHARATKRAAWDGPDSERPLDDRGVADAAALVGVLAAYGVEAVHSSDTTRCLDTVAPFATARGLGIVAEIAVSEHGHTTKPTAAAKRVRKLLQLGGRLVLCSHRPVLPAVLKAALGGSETQDVIGDGLPPGAMVVIHHVGERVLAVERHDP
ncbi:MAG TPA: NUDIX domain-containing protein [Candidatus Limnocylindria bacterium]|nr:NUDIX domain-containing protein [Candidatus Limnocylindria bacterium]